MGRAKKWKNSVRLASAPAPGLPHNLIVGKYLDLLAGRPVQLPGQRALDRSSSKGAHQLASSEGHEVREVRSNSKPRASDVFRDSVVFSSPIKELFRSTVF